jgi:cytoskeleton protein RodZ
VTVQAAVAHPVAASDAAEVASAAAPPASAAGDSDGQGGELMNASALSDPTPAPGPAPAASTAPAPVPAPVASPPSAAAAATPVADTGGDGKVSLRLTFSATSWIDVRDATGRRLFVGHGYVNTMRSVVGRAPLTVRIGYIGGVRVEINDREVSIDRSLRSGDIARFLAGADGRPHPLTGKLPAPG